MTRTSFLAAALLVVAPISVRGADWPQFNLDARHSGASQQETVVHSGNVATLHARYHVALPGVADGAPAFLAGVTTPLGVKDLLFLTTKNGWTVACDAATGGVVWSHQPAAGPNYTTSMPAVDPGRQYVYSYGLEGRVHKYEVGDGTEIVTGGWPQVATLKPSVEKSSPGLAVAVARDGTPYLYVANGGYPGDAGDYQGHITAINLTTGAQRVFNANCSDQTVHFTLGGSPDCPAVQTAIWARAGVVYDADTDRIFMATGNGDFNANVGGHNWGDSVFALNPDGTGTGSGPVDSYTPAEFQQLQNTDADLGSTAPALFPPLPGSTVAHVGLQSGKDAQLRLLDMDNLSGAAAPGHVGGELQKISVPQGGEVLTASAVWRDAVDGGIWVFLANGSGISGLELTVGGSGAPLLVSRWTTGNGGTSPIVVNGILYYAGPTGIRALDPATGAPLWSAPIGGIHWESPILVNGRLYVADEGGNLRAFEPDSAPPPSATKFYTVLPCRILDTRAGSGLPAGYGPPSIAGGGTQRSFVITEQCGIPGGAQAVSINAAVWAPTTRGDLRVFPGSGIAPNASTLNWEANILALANAAVVPLNAAGAITVQVDGPGTVDIFFDVNGYFQ